MTKVCEFRLLKKIIKNKPLKEICVFGLSYQTSSHHDGLEALTLDGPQPAVGGGFDCGGSLAVVQYGQLTEHLAGCHRA